MSSEDIFNVICYISIILTWCIRGNLCNHFNYEAGFGVGYVHYFKEDNAVLLFESGVAVNLHLRIGYRF